MVRKFSIAVLAAMLILPTLAFAGPTPEELAQKIEKLTRELSEVRAQMEELKSSTEESMEEIDEKSEAWDLASRFNLSGDFRARGDYVSADSPEFWSANTVAQGFTKVLATGQVFSQVPGATPVAPLLGVTSLSQFQAALGLMGVTPSTQALEDAWTTFGVMGADIAQMVTANPGLTVGDLVPLMTDPKQLAALMKGKSAAERSQMMTALLGGAGPYYNPSTTYQNDTMLTNRFRLNMRVKATEDIEFKARLAMYKAWGMENNPVDYSLMGGPFMLNSLSFDGNSTRQPDDNALRVDRAFVNWNNIGGLPVWFSIGRRPTTDGPPSQLRMGSDKRLATPVAYMDYPFDGISLGYAYADLFNRDWPGRIRFCYGRGFEAGPNENDNGLNDVDFAGLSWDVYKKGDRFMNIQSFAAMNMFNVPDNITFQNPLEQAQMSYNSMDLAAGDAATFTGASPNGTLDRANLGNIYHTSAVYMDKVNDLNYFLTLGWSRTDPNKLDEMGTGLLTSWWDENYDDAKDGYAVYAGVRYDLDEYNLKLGLEYNYGSKDWISFTPGNDDVYASKLGTRGHVGEAYLVWDIPAGETISKYGSAFIRLGYQHYIYNYTGSGYWLGEPLDVDDLADDPLNAQFWAPIDTMDQVYLTFEATF